MSFFDASVYIILATFTVNAELKQQVKNVLPLCNYKDEVYKLKKMKQKNLQQYYFAVMQTYIVSTI